jgi:hypothetical protein
MRFVSAQCLWRSEGMTHWFMHWLWTCLICGAVVSDSFYVQSSAHLVEESDKLSVSMVQM